MKCAKLINGRSDGGGALLGGGGGGLVGHIYTNQLLQNNSSIRFEELKNEFINNFSN